MKKGLIFGFLLLIIGFLFWAMVVNQLSSPVDDVAAKADKENFQSFTCPSCSKLFMAEGTTKKGNCPYCGFTMMLSIEQKRVISAGIDRNEFTPFLSPACGKLFFAYAVGEAGKCPYCGESIVLAAAETSMPEDAPPALLALANEYRHMILLALIILGGLSGVTIYFLLQNRVVLSLEAVSGALADSGKIKLLKRQIKKKHLTLGPLPYADIKIDHPSLKDFDCTLSFVRVGGNTHVYLRRNSNQPLWVNDKPEYNAQLKDRDKIKLGDLVFEVHSTKN